MGIAFVQEYWNVRMKLELFKLFLQLFKIVCLHVGRISLKSTYFCQMVQIIRRRRLVQVCCARKTLGQCVTSKWSSCAAERDPCVCEVTQPLRIFPRTIYSKHLDSKQQPTIWSQLPSLSKLCLFAWFRSRKKAKLRHITGNCWKPPPHPPPPVYNEEKGS